MTDEANILCGVVLSVLLIILAICSITIIPAGHVGVYDLFGQVEERELYPGFHLKLPVASIHTMSVKTQEYTMTSIQGEGAVESADAVLALSKDGLKIDLDITVLYKLNSEKADEVYKTIGMNYRDVIIRPQISSVIPKITSKYEADKIYSEDRQQVEMDIQTELRVQLEQKGIIVEKVLLRKVLPPESISNAIEAKLATEQLIKQKDYEVQIEEKEAERKIAEAEGIARANEIISGSITTNYLNWYWIESLPNHESVIYVPIGNDGLPIMKSIQ